MPELPEVESVRRQLEPELSGRRALAVWADTQRRFHAPGLLQGRTVEGVGRRGKVLLCPLDQGLELVLHLGDGVPHFGAPDAYARARITLDDGRERCSGTYAASAAWRSSRPAPTGRCRAWPPRPRAALRRVRPPPFARDLAATRAPVKPYLLSQRPVAGVGNMCRRGPVAVPHPPRSPQVGPDGPWRPRRHPPGPDRRHRPRRHHLPRLPLVNGESGRNADFLIAYGQSGRPCPRCATPLRKVALGGRDTTFCPSCQRR